MEGTRFIGEHGPEVVQTGKPEPADVLAAILEELKVIRGLLQSQDDEKPVFIFSKEEGAIKATTKGALRAEEAKWAGWSCPDCFDAYDGKPLCDGCPMPAERRTTPPLSIDLADQALRAMTDNHRHGIEKLQNDSRHILEEVRLHQTKSSR